MRKRDELVAGCMAKAHDDEMTFVLLGRDPAASRSSGSSRRGRSPNGEA